MTVFQLKVIAIVTMVIDHVGLIFFPEHHIFRLIGRIAFPLFAWMIANGYHYTKNLRAYIGRLGLLAVISQLPYSLLFGTLYGIPYRLNVFVTLLLGLLFITCYEHLRHDRVIRILVLCAIVVVAAYVPTGYGIYGMCLIVLFHSTRAKKREQFFYACIFLSSAALVGPILLPSVPASMRPLIPVVPIIQLGALVAVPLIYVYNEQPGFARYRSWFYWFYPVHLSLLFVLSLVL